MMRSLLSFIQAMFAQRRKTLLNNLSNAYKFSKEEIAKILEEFNYSSQIRSEELSLEEIYKIYTAIFTSPQN